MRYKFLLVIAVFIISCNDDKDYDPEAVKKQIADAEKAFERMAAEKGIAEAFWYYADSNAVISRRGDTLIYGKEQIRNFYSTDFYKTASVKWSADFIDVAEDGDMAYTYGKYLWQSKDSTGKVTESKGVFHTVWKKRKDGTWKYVWD
jgi:ketosteroid isomerase-like protein